MSYIFMVYHYPDASHRQTLLEGMWGFGEQLARQPGLIEVAAWEDVNSEALIGLSVWESEEAFRAAVPPGFGEPSSVVPPGETKPRVPVHLVRRDPPHSLSNS